MQSFGSKWDSSSLTFLVKPLKDQCVPLYLPMWIRTFLNCTILF
jgi:hypothetical protein